MTANLKAGAADSRCLIALLEREAPDAVAFQELSCEKILEFRCGRWHTTHDLVATDAGKHNAIPLRG